MGTACVHAAAFILWAPHENVCVHTQLLLAPIGAHKYWVSWFQINKCSAFCLFVFFFFFPTSVNQRLSPGGFASTGRSSVAFPRGSSALVGCFYLPPDCMSPGAELPCGGCQHTQSESNAGVDGWDEKTKRIIVLLAPNSNLQRKLVSIPIFTLT